MFEVYHKEDLCAYKVYHVRTDKNGFAHFLIYKYLGDGNFAWVYESAKNFMPK